MMQMRKWMILLCMGVLFMGCSENEGTFSPEKMISRALEETEELRSYMGEAKIIYDEEELSIKEWHHEDGRSRVEVSEADGEIAAITVNDGEQFITYDIKENQATVIDDPEIMALNERSPKDQAELSLSLVKDTHELDMKGEEEVAGRPTKHIVATPKEDNSLFGKQELWIDKENWFVLKMKTETNGQISEMAYSKIEFGIDLSEDQFELELPDDVHIVDLDDVIEGDEIDLQEAVAALGRSFLYFPEEDGLEISSVQKNELQGEFNRVEVDIEYMKDDLPYVTLSIFEVPDDLDEDFEFPGEEKVTLRDIEGTYTDLGDDFRAVMWDENGLRYSLIIVDATIELEEIQSLAEIMEPVTQ